MTAREFKKLIRDTAARVSREELEAEFFDFYQPADGLAREHLDELVREFLEEYPQGEPMAEETKPPSPWAKPEPGKTKHVELSPEAFRILSKFAAKRGLMVGKTPSDALEALFKQFRVEETS